MEEPIDMLRMNLFLFVPFLLLVHVTSAGMSWGDENVQSVQLSLNNIFVIIYIEVVQQWDKRN